MKENYEDLRNICREEQYHYINTRHIEGRILFEQVKMFILSSSVLADDSHIDGWIHFRQIKMLLSQCQPSQKLVIMMDEFLWCKYKCSYAHFWRKLIISSIVSNSKCKSSSLTIHKISLTSLLLSVSSESRPF